MPASLAWALQVVFLASSCLSPQSGLLRSMESMGLGSFLIFQRKMNRMWTIRHVQDETKGPLAVRGIGRETKWSSHFNPKLSVSLELEEMNFLSKSRTQPCCCMSRNSLWFWAFIAFAPRVSAICHRGPWLSRQREKRKGSGAETVEGLSKHLQGHANCQHEGRWDDDHSGYSRMPVVCLLSPHSLTLLLLEYVAV